MVFCTEFLDGRWSWEPLRSSCVRCGWCRAVAGHHPHSTHDLRSSSQDHHPPTLSQLYVLLSRSIGEFQSKLVRWIYLLKVNWIGRIYFTSFKSKEVLPEQKSSTLTQSCPVSALLYNCTSITQQFCVTLAIGITWQKHGVGGGKNRPWALWTQVPLFCFP